MHCLNLPSSAARWCAGIALPVLLAGAATAQTPQQTQPDIKPASVPGPVEGAGGNRLILLGTKGGPTADPERSEPANLLVIGKETYLIDAGAGVAHQLARAGYSPPSVHTVFLTHLHIDHSAGLEPLISLDWIGTGLSGKPAPQYRVYGPPTTDRLVAASLDFLQVSERIFRAGIPALPGARTMFLAHVIDSDGRVFDDGQVRVTAARNTHYSNASIGPDGRADMSFSYRFDTPSGSIVFTGDTGPSDAVTRLAKDADILVSEVYLPIAGLSGSASPLLTELAEHMNREHLTPEEVGRMAAAAGVREVVLTHIVAAPSPNLEAELRAGVAKHFKGRVIIAHDLMTIAL